MSREDLEGLARRLLERLRAGGLTLATAESCTGGLLGAVLTSVAGASRAYRGGVVAYADDVKVRLVGVDEALLARHGAVSAEVARALARGAAARLEASLGLGVTGIAGPEGGTPEKPVGTVHVAAFFDGRGLERHLMLSGDREDVRRESVRAAIALALALLDGERV